ncbi:N-acetyl-alpha-D-glucosaminyl L-malate deacetylase 1 [Candidatus Entotheonellaceae bacterium PAL068K]
MAHLVTLLAHPDDAEILAGGTLYHHRQRGDRVVICSLTYTRDSPRGQEGAEGARRLDADFMCFGFTDMAVPRYTAEDVERVAAFLLAQPPDMVLTHWQEDTHPDHAAVARLVVEALLRYAVTYGLEDVGASRQAFPSVWSCDTYGALGRYGGFEPERYIDISGSWTQKSQAIAAHQSQNPAYWIEQARRHNAFYGARCNRDYAEGFRRLPLAMMSNLPAHDYLF